MTPNAEIVHQHFRGAAEVVKILRFIALISDLGGATIAVLGFWDIISTKSGWIPCEILGAAILGILLRSYALGVRAYSLSCRKASVRAFSLDQDIDVVTRTDLEEQSPPFAAMLAKRLPASDLTAYYEPTMPIGYKRLCELYAHSAFYTRRLTKIYGFVSGTAAVVVFIFAFVIFYYLAMNNIEKLVREAVITTICSSIFIVIFARLLQLTIACRTTAVSLLRIEKALLAMPKTERLRDIVDEYDITRATGTDIPTSLYRLRREAIQQEWYVRRQAFL